MTLTPTFNPLWLATDNGGHDYLANNQGEIRKYKGSETNPANDVADCTITAAGGDGPIAVAPDKTIYIVVKVQTGGIADETIDAITGCTSGAATVSRTIGPFGNQYISALAVDKKASCTSRRTCSRMRRRRGCASTRASRTASPRRCGSSRRARKRTTFAGWRSSSDARAGERV